MDVLERARKVEFPLLDFGGNLVKAPGDLRAFFLGDDAAIGKHRGMGLGRKNIVAPEALVEVDGGVYLLHDRGGGR
jgi:hypothetical protein